MLVSLSPQNTSFPFPVSASNAEDMVIGDTLSAGYALC